MNSECKDARAVSSFFATMADPKASDRYVLSYSASGRRTCGIHFRQGSIAKRQGIVVVTVIWSFWSMERIPGHSNGSGKKKGQVKTIGLKRILSCFAQLCWDWR